MRNWPDVVVPVGPRHRLVGPCAYTPKAHPIETIPSIISIAGTSIIATALTLGAGKDYEKAFEFGRSAIDLKGIPEYLTPVLKKKT